MSCDSQLAFSNVSFEEGPEAIDLTLLQDMITSESVKTQS